MEQGTFTYDKKRYTTIYITKIYMIITSTKIK